MIDAYVKECIGKASAAAQNERLRRVALERQMAETERHDAEIMRGMP